MKEGIWSFAAGLVFARVGAMVMLVPGLGDASVPPRIRLSFALLMAMVLTPLVAPNVTVPGAVSGVAGEVIRETLIGLMIGAILRMTLNALAVAGEVVAIQTTLGFAQTASPNQAQPSATLSTFLNLIGVTLVMMSVGMWLKKSGHADLGEAVVSMAFPMSMVWSLPFYMKGQPWRAQALLIAVPSAILIGLGWLSTRI